jgi:hypothetical protein
MATLHLLRDRSETFALFALNETVHLDDARVSR